MADDRKSGPAGPARLTPLRLLFPARLLRETGAGTNPFLLRAARRRGRWRAVALHRSMDVLLLLLTTFVAAVVIGGWGTQEYLLLRWGPRPDVLYPLAFSGWFLLLVFHQLARFDRTVMLRPLRPGNLDELYLTPMGRDEYFLHPFCECCGRFRGFCAVALIVVLVVVLDLLTGSAAHQREEGDYWAGPIMLLVFAGVAGILGTFQFLVEWRLWAGRRGRLNNTLTSTLLTFLLLLPGAIGFYCIVHALLSVFERLVIRWEVEHLLLLGSLLLVIVLLYLSVVLLARFTHLGACERLFHRQLWGGARRPPLPLHSGSFIAVTFNPRLWRRVPASREAGGGLFRAQGVRFLCWFLVPVLLMGWFGPFSLPSWLWLREMIGFLPDRASMVPRMERPSLLPAAIYLLAGPALLFRHLVAATDREGAWAGMLAGARKLSMLALALVPVALVEQLFVESLVRRSFGATPTSLGTTLSSGLSFGLLNAALYLLLAPLLAVGCCLVIRGRGLGQRALAALAIFLAALVVTLFASLFSPTDDFWQLLQGGYYLLWLSDGAAHLGGLLISLPLLYAALCLDPLIERLWPPATD